MNKTSKRKINVVLFIMTNIYHVDKINFCPDDKVFSLKQSIK